MVDPYLLKSIVMDRFKKDPSILMDAISKDDNLKVLPPNLKNTILLFMQRNSSHLLDKMQPQLEVFAELIFEKMIGSLPKSAKRGHIQALNNSPIPDYKIKEYSDLQYAVSILPNEKLILGDSGVVLEGESGKYYNSLFDSGDPLKNIFLPISKKHLIIGSKKLSINSVHSREMIAAIANCSREYFVSPFKLEQKDAQALTNQIGSGTKLLSKEMSRKIVTQSLKKDKTL